MKKLNYLFLEEGIMINSGEFNGLSSKDALIKIAEYVEEKNLGQRTYKYRLKDWGISRQRYWGTPIPVLYCEKCGEVLEKDESHLSFPSITMHRSVSGRYNAVICHYSSQYQGDRVYQ